MAELSHKESTENSVDPKEFQREMQRRIEAEVRRKRKEGLLLPSVEAEMRRIYERLLPKGIGRSAEDFAHLMYTIDRSAVIDIDVPLRSRIAGVTYVKTVLRKLMAWYLNYVTQQLTNFHANLSQLIHALDLRLSQIERALPSTRELPLVYEVTLSDDAITVVAGQVVPRTGPECEVDRILVSAAGANGLLRSLDGLGYNVYGIDRVPARLDDLARHGVEVRNERLRTHVDRLAPASLGAAVLQGDFELLELGDKLAVLEGLTSALAPGGRVVLVGHDPSVATRSRAERVAVDLSPGSYLHRETWEFLFEFFGFTSIESDTIPSGSSRKSHLFHVSAVVSGASTT
ncbi:MAG: hypothetical protein ACP5PJ_02235 [Acidimicrobiales bacterium]